MPKSWNQLAVVTSVLRQTLKQLRLFLLFFAMLGIFQQASAQTGFWNLTVSPNGGTVGSDGTLYVTFGGSVNAIEVNDAVIWVRIYEGGALLRETSYNIGYDKFGNPINTTRLFAMGMPLTAGTHQLHAEAATVNGGFNSQVLSVVVQPPPYNGASFISQSIPANMVAGQTYPVSVTMANNGTKTWAAGGTNPHRLGAQTPDSTWGYGRVELPSTVAPGGQVTFNFNVTAPQSGGAVGFQARMLQEGIGFFGDATPNVNVQVSIPQPTAVFSSPNESASYTATGNTVSVAFAGNANPGSGAAISNVQLLEGGTMFANTSTGSISGSKELAVGSHTIELRVTDSRGQTASVFRTVRVVAPSTATFTSPASGATIVASGTTTPVSVSASAVASSGSSVSRIRLFVDGTESGTNASINISASFPLAVGAHTLGVDAIDGNGVAGPRSFITVTVVVPQGPTAIISSPSNNSSFVASGSSANVNINASGTPAAGASISKLNLYVDGAFSQSSLSGALIATVPLQVGGHTLSIEAIDNFGTTGPRSSISINVVVPPAPTASISSPANNSSFVASGNTANVNVTAAGTPATGASISKLNLYVDGVALPSFPSSSLTATLPLVIGGHTLSIEAVDNFGTTGPRSSISVAVTGPPPPASASFNSPSNGATFIATGSTVSVPISATGVPATGATIGQMKFYVDGILTLNGNSATFSATQALALGNHTLSIEAVDNFGTTGPRSNISVAVTGPPSPASASFSSPANGATFILTGSTVSVPVSATSVPATGASISQMRYYVDGVLTITGTSATFNATQALGLGNHTLGIEAVDNYGTVGPRTNISVVVSRPAAPTAAFVKPASGSTFSSSAGQSSVAVSGSGSPAQGATVSEMRLYVDGDRFSTSSSASLDATVPLSTGSHTLGLEAMDNFGSVSTRTNITVAITSPSSATPVAVTVTPPHLGNADAGTLPGQLSVGSDGAASYSIDIAVPPGTAGMQPKLTLAYSSNNPNGMLGLGWTLGGLSSIHRCPKTLAQDGMVGRIGFTTADRLCLDGIRLLRSDGPNPGSDPAAQDANYWAIGAQYRTEIESFSRITRLSNGFKVELKDGRIQYYGQNADGSDLSGAIQAQGRVGNTLLWALARTEDRSGNFMTVQYTTDINTGEYLPIQIRYGDNSKVNHGSDLAVRFSYESRPDVKIQYIGGSRNDLRNRLTNVQTFINTATDGTGGSRVRNYILHYTLSNNSGRSLIDWIQVCASSDSECLPRTTMSWGNNPMKLVQTGEWKETVNGDNETFPLKSVTGDFAGNGTSITLYPLQGTLAGAAGRTYFLSGMYSRSYEAQIVFSPYNSRTYYSEVLAADLDGDGRDDLIFIDTVSHRWTYCMALPPEGLNLKFSTCQIGPGVLPGPRGLESNPQNLPTVVSLRSDGRSQLLAFDASNNLTLCSYSNNGMSCSTNPITLPPGVPGIDAVPVDLSKQGMTDFYSSWISNNFQSSGITVCNFYDEKLVCKVVSNDSMQLSAERDNPSDLNGDGLTDFVYRGRDSNGVPVQRLCLSTETDVDCNSISINNSLNGQYYLLPGSGDSTGDGVNYFVGSIGQTGVGLCHVVGTSTVCQSIDATEIPDMNTKYPYPPQDMATTGVFDQSGIRSFKRCTIPYFEANHFYQNCISYTARVAANQDKLTAVVNGFGQREEIDYARGDDSSVYTRFATVGGVEQRPIYPQLANNPGVMVKQIRRNNGHGGWISSSYKYAGAMRDARGRGSLGFTKFSVIDANGIVTEQTFAQTFPFVGALTNENRSAQSCILEDTVNVFEQQPFSMGSGNQSVFVNIRQSSVTRHDLSCNELGTITTVNEYTDGWGNLNTKTVTSTGNGETFTTKTVSVFNTGIGINYLSGMPTSIMTTRRNSKNESLTRTTSYTYNSITGLLDTETIEPTNTAYKLVTTYDRTANPFGLVNKQIQNWTDPTCADSGWPSSLNGACITEKVRTLSDVTYDAKGRFPRTVKNALLHTETYLYDEGSGTQVQRKDSNNLTTNWSLNGFGVVTVERGPDGNEERSYAKVCAGDCPDGATIARVKEHFNGSVRTATPEVSYIDSAGHILHMLDWGWDGRRIVTVQRYDSLGRLWETDWPRFDEDPAYLAKRIEYDDLNRTTIVTSIDENGTARASKTDYQGFKRVLTNARLQVRVELRDVIEQVRQVDDSNQPVGITKFEYDAFGNMVNMTDASLNVIKVSYDLLGRRTDLRDPDLGWIHYDVDPLGQVWGQISPNQRAKGQKTYTSYDMLGRMTARYELDLESHWIYDAATGGVGKLAQAYTKSGSNIDYSRTHTFDAVGRPKLTTTRLSDGTYIGQISYDAWGRVITNTYQRNGDAPKVFDSRYENGYLYRIERGGLVLWQMTAIDAQRQAIKVAFGNGLTRTTTFYPQTNRLKNVILVSTNNLAMLTEGYNYDELGNVHQRTQYWDKGGFSEAFSYDSLNRLETSRVDEQPEQRFVYDATGNIKSKTDIGTYGYSEQGPQSVRPHAVQSVSSMVGTFQYDDNGNLLSGGGKSSSWTSFDMPKQVSKGTSASTFTYGPEHQRVRQDRSDGLVVVYAGSQEVETKAGVVTVKTYWPNGIGVEIDRGSSPTEMSWTHVDRLGSIIALTDQNGAIREKLEYDVWGKRRSVIDNISTTDNIDGLIDNRGFTGHEMLDQLDLVHMNGRVYDPLIGRFFSADPYVQDPYNGQNYNRFSYVLNNPTNLTDPTGYEWTEWVPVYGSIQDYRKSMAEGAYAIAAVHAALAIADGASLGVGSLIKIGVKAGIKGVIMAEMKHETVEQLSKHAGEQAAHATEKAAAEQAAKQTEKAAAEEGAATGTNGATASERAKNSYTPGGKFSQKTKADAADRAGKKCEFCGTDTVPAKKSQKGVNPPKNEAQTDHIQPRSKGGDNSPANAAHSCRECNRRNSNSDKPNPRDQQQPQQPKQPEPSQPPQDPNSKF